MDHVRSCYRTEMNFFRDGFRAVPVRWFFAAPTAQLFPGISTFKSANWDSDKNATWPLLGEVQGAPRRWDNGNNANGKMGDHYCGKLEWYETGVSVHDVIPPTSECCPSNPQLVLVSATCNAVGGCTYNQPKVV